MKTIELSEENTEQNGFLQMLLTPSYRTFFKDGDKDEDEDDKDEDDGDKPTIESLTKERDDARAEAAKYKGQKVKIAKERDDLKKKVSEQPDESETAKQLATERDRTKAILERTKAADIKAALSTQLTKLGVQADKIDAAIKLTDTSSITWDEEDGIDAASVETAVAANKKSNGFLFEKKVPATDPKKAGEGKTQDNDKLMKRADFDKMTDYEAKSKFMMEGGKLED